MRVAWLGLGKLGLPCAAVLAQHHWVQWLDTDPDRVRATIEAPPAWERGLAELLPRVRNTLTEMADPEGMTHWADIVMIAVPTPHAPGLDGTEPHSVAQDFGYAQVLDALLVAKRYATPGTPICLVSTVAPGTAARLELQAWLPQHPYVYHPAFIAMGTTISDYRHPEFRLVGYAWPHDNRTENRALSQVGEALTELYAPIDGTRRLSFVSVAEAEVTKMLYNTWIGLKIGFANTLGQIADGVGADADVVTALLEGATDRVNSWAYMGAGMGDGGACHPRDQLVLAHLAEQYGIDHDLFTATIMAREQHATWLAGLVRQAHGRHPHLGTFGGDRPVAILGYAYKPDTALSYGSHALLVAKLLEDMEPVAIDAQFGDDEAVLERMASTVLVAVGHERYRSMVFAPGSVVIDPLGIIDPALNPEAILIRPGRRPGRPQWTLTPAAPTT